jgi:hypothetical protein
MKPGDILITLAGYEQTNVRFYKVVGLSALMATVQRLENIETDHKNMTCLCVPSDKPVGAPFRRKIYRVGSPDEYVLIKAHEITDPWNGEPARQTSYA